MTAQLTETDLFGRFYLKKFPEEGKYNNYYATLDAIRPLLKSEEWRASVTGYFINAPVTRDALRLSYFTTRPQEVAKAVEDFISAHNIKYAQDGEAARPIFLSGPYGGEEIRFRRFLSVSTRVVLDVMESDLLYARRLFAAFRFNFMKTGAPYEDFFKGTFEKKSPAYRSLSDGEKKQFWLDMAHWPNPPQVDWIHLPVNMAIGSDMNSFGKWQEYINAKYTLKQEDIKSILSAQGLDLPLDWQPV